MKLSSPLEQTKVPPSALVLGGTQVKKSLHDFPQFQQFEPRPGDGNDDVHTGNPQQQHHAPIRCGHSPNRLNHASPTDLLRCLRLSGRGARALPRRAAIEPVLIELAVLIV